MWIHLRNILIVVLVTIVIWGFAEAESLRSAEVRSVEIEFKAEPGSKYVVDLTQDMPSVRGNTVRVDMIVEGPAAALDSVERALRRTITVSPGMEGLGVDPGRHPVDLATILSHHPDIPGRGVTFRNLSPESVEATVDELVVKTVKVEVDMPAGAELESSPELKTSTATVSLPSALASRVTDATTLIARIEPAALNRLTPGRKETMTNVKLIPPADLAGTPRLKIEPAGVDVSLTLRSKLASVKLTSVPVHIRLPAASINQWEIEVPVQDRVLVDVTVSGPSDVIKQIQDRTLQVIATVALSPDELDTMIPSKDAVFCDLPTPGLRFDVANKTVRLKIRKREPVGPLKQ